MSQKIKKLLRKAANVVLTPLLDEYFATQDRQNQILLFLKYREFAKTQGLDFQQAGFNIYSVTYEDGILLYLFALIGMTDRRCVDLGGATVGGSIVANLIVNHGFTGLLVDGNPRSVQATRQYYADHPQTRLFPPKTVATMVTAENVNGLLKENGFVDEMDLFCLDIDGMDYWVWKAINVIQPRLVVLEYQDVLGPEKAWTVPYKPDFRIQDYPVNKQSNNYCGASLRAFVKLGKVKGYRLIGCNRGGWNAFFVRDGVCDDYLPEVGVESCFKSDWNRYSIQERFPLVKDMEWQEV